MQLPRLLKMLDKADRDHLHIRGPYGTIVARPDGMCHPQSDEPTYQVDARYRTAGDGNTTRVRQNGFRFSTVCCLCATVCMGEARVDQQVFAAINAQFA